MKNKEKTEQLSLLPTDDSTATSIELTPIQRLKQQIYRFWVHSYIYYRLNEAIISDQEYDAICQDLDVEYKKLKHRKDSQLDQIAQHLGPEASGFNIKSYPSWVVSSASQLLYNAKYKSSMSFHDFVSRFGLRQAPKNT